MKKTSTNHPILKNCIFMRTNMNTSAFAPFLVILISLLTGCSPNVDRDTAGIFSEKPRRAQPEGELADRISKIENRMQSLEHFVVDTGSPREHAITTLTSLRLLDSAKEQYALENNKESGAITGAQVAPYLKIGSRLHMAAEEAGSSHLITDPYLGHTYNLNEIGQLPSVENIDVTLLRATDTDFWAPFPVANENLGQECLSQAKQIELACRLYAVDHKGSFPINLSQLVPDYLPDMYIFSSPLAPLSGNMDYEYFGNGLTESSAGDLRLLQGKYTTGDKKRSVVFVNLSGELIAD